MDSRPVVIVGANGLLGAVTVDQWRQARPGADAVVALTRADVDVTDHARVTDVLSRLSPSVVVNCTAYNRVDDAEGEPGVALSVNAWAVRSMARAAAAVGAVFVHYSTDFVFDGEAAQPYTEEDAPNPRSAYGMSKLVGEWLAAEVPRHYILRVESLFGGAASRSSLDTMLASFRAGRPVRAFADRTVSPSHVGDIARATRALVEQAAPVGLYHCVNTGAATWVEVAEAVRALAGLPDASIEPVRLSDMQLKAQRPRYCALSNAKLQATGIVMPTWQDALRQHVVQGS